MSKLLPKYKPLPHQLIMCDYLCKNTGGLLFCEMRTGKTLGAILFLIRHRKIPILIVAPCMALQNWYNWLVAQGFDSNLISVLEDTRGKRERELAKDLPIIIANYEMSILYKLKYRKDWKVIIFDESYRLANITASVTQYWVRGDIPSDQSRIMITGEPAPENPLNFATQYFIQRGQFMGYDSYTQYYLSNWRKCDYTGRDVPIRPSHVDEIREYVRDTAHCVTMDSLNLGSKVFYNVTEFRMNPRQIKLMSKVIDMHNEAKKLVGIPVNENSLKLKAISMERLISAGMDPEDHTMVNRDKLKYIIETYQETNEPLVVFSHYRAPLFELERMLKNKNIECGLLHGQTGKPSVKEEIVQAFDNAEFDIFLGQTRSCKYNYNLSRSSSTIYLTNSYSRDDRSQSEKRTTNLAKKVPVEIMDLCYKDTMDLSLVKRLKSKKKISYSFIDLEFEGLSRERKALLE